MRNTRLIRRKAFFSVLICCIMAFGGLACKGKPEAVITDDGQDITEQAKEYDTLAHSEAKKFSYEDLAIGSVKCFDDESQIKLFFGEPLKVVNLESAGISEKAENSNRDKAYVYDERTMTFSYIDGAYKLTAVESYSKKDRFARGIFVGSTFDDIMAAYYRDENCMNNNYYSADKSIVLGKFLYGSYTLDMLDAVKPSGKVEYGVINFNGYANLEEAESYIVEMTYFEPPYKGANAVVTDDFAQIAFDIGKDGVVTAIRWYYYPEEK